MELTIFMRSHEMVNVTDGRNINFDVDFLLNSFFISI